MTDARPTSSPTAAATACAYILEQNLGAGLDQLGGLLAAGIAFAMTFCGFSSIASAGRMLFAFSRDDGVPGSGWLKKVSKRWRTPSNAVIAISVASWLLILLVYVLTKALGGDPFFLIAGITAVSTVLLYWAYGVCICLGLRGDQSWRERQTWSLGRWSRPLAWISVIWIILFSPLFLYPFELNPASLADRRRRSCVLLAIYYFAWARTRFRGPGRPGHGRAAQRDRAGVRSRPPARSPTPDRSHRQLDGPAGQPAGPSSISASSARRVRHERRRTAAGTRQAPAARRARGLGPRRPDRHDRRGDHGHAGPAHGQARPGRGVPQRRHRPRRALLHVPARHGHGDEHARGLPAHELGDRLRRLDRRRRSGTRCGSCPGWRRPRSSSSDTIDEETHKEIPISPRTILKRQVERAAAAGITRQGRLGVRVLRPQGHVGRDGRERLRDPEAVRLRTTRTTTSSRRRRPSRSTGSCATS